MSRVRLFAGVVLLSAPTAFAHPGHGLLPHLPAHGADLLPVVILVVLMAVGVVLARRWR